MISCFGTAVVIARGSERGDRLYNFNLSEEPLILNGGLQLAVLQRFIMLQPGRTRGGWEATIAAYSFELSTNDGHELVAYHWNSVTRVGVPYPHIHIGRSLAHPALPSPFRRQISQLSKAHLPTGFISLAQLLETLVIDLDVVPRRNDWSEVLAAADMDLGATFPPETPHVHP